jgi:hypothetical protein
VKRALTEHAFLVGTFQKIELKALELLQQSTERRRVLADFRSEAVSIYEALSNDEERQWNLLQRISTRLQNTDLLDHFAAGLHRRMNRILKTTAQNFNEDTLPSPPGKGHHWFLFTIGRLHVAALGRLVHYCRVNGRKKIRAPFPIRVFPGTDLWTNGPLYLIVLETKNKDHVAIYANAMNVLPPFFEPSPLLPVDHRDLLGKIRYGAHNVYVLKP